jgi:hypothetical protein
MPFFRRSTLNQLIQQQLGEQAHKLALKMRFSLPVLEDAIARTRRRGIEPGPAVLAPMLSLAEALGVSVTAFDEAKQLALSKRELAQNQRADAEATKLRTADQVAMLEASIRQVREECEVQVASLVINAEQCDSRAAELEGLRAMCELVPAQ